VVIRKLAYVFNATKSMELVIDLVSEHSLFKCRQCMLGKIPKHSNKPCISRKRMCEKF